MSICEGGHSIYSQHAGPSSSQGYGELIGGWARMDIRNPVFLQTETDISGASGPTGLILIDPPITGLRRCLQLETCSPSRDAVSVALLSLSCSWICRIYRY